MCVCVYVCVCVCVCVLVFYVLCVFYGMWSLIYKYQMHIIYVFVCNLDVWPECAWFVGYSEHNACDGFAAAGKVQICVHLDNIWNVDDLINVFIQNELNKTISL